ncbi:MAG TPA: polysaccharide deacetylase family protein [Bacteroidales bacterium]|nr:polysaccharide deacetylase family protein [Bacteroidales bacterium]
MKKESFVFILFMIIAGSANAQKNLAEMLGYPGDSKLLIIHADDMGLSQSVNAACLQAFSDMSITSGSIMVPCPWAYEMAGLIRNNTGVDAGIHLTLTAEWDRYRWDGVSSSDSIRSLLDSDGYFYRSVEDVAKHVNPEEAAKEMEGQIKRAMALGVHPTHLDTHMGSVLARPELIKIYFSLAEKYNLPVLFPRVYLSMLPKDMQEKYGKSIYLLDNLFMLEPLMIKDGNWMEVYTKAVKSLKPGLNQIIVHIAFDNDEMKAISNGHDDYGSKWRQRDFDLVQSKEFRELLKANNIILISWGQVKNLMN